MGNAGSGSIRGVPSERTVKVPSAARRRALRSVDRSAVWSTCAAATIALILTSLALVLGHIDAMDLFRLGFLLVVAIGYGELTDRVEQPRRFSGNGRLRTNHLSVWSIVAVLVLPPGLACVLVLLLYLHALIRGRRRRTVRTHRVIFAAAAATIAAYGAATVVSVITDGVCGPEGIRAALASAAAAPLFLTVDTLLMVLGTYLALRPASVMAVLPNRDLFALAWATGLLGVVGAQLLLRTPWLFPVVVGGLVAIHRASLVKQLLIAATIDAKTTLLNASAWRERALQAVVHAAATGQRVAVIVIDLDFFKRVNDTYGHLEGDRVLQTVALTLRSQTRARDIVGRFGGEEFVIFIDGRGAENYAIDIATRIRERIADATLIAGIPVTATLGVAYGVPDSPESLDILLDLADTALYEGKASGRDRVNAYTFDLAPILLDQTAADRVD